MNYPISAEYTSSLCEITTPSNELISFGIIKEVEEDYIKISAKDGIMRLISTGEDVKINIHNSRLGFTVIIAEVLTSTLQEMKIVNILQIVSHERRNYFRVEVELRAKIAASEQFLNDANEENVYFVLIRDLSLCGLRFETFEEFELGQDLWIMLNFNDRPMICHFKVKRIIESENKKKQYGGEFLFEKKSDNDKLCSFLFKKQRENAKKYRGSI